MCTKSFGVLHITLSSMIGGGPEHVWQLVRHLPDHITSFVAAPDTRPYGSRFLQAAGRERFCVMPQRKFSLPSLWRLIYFLKRNKIDIVHSHGKGAGVYGRIAALVTGIPNVHTFHGVHLPANQVKRRAYLSLERALCSISKACIVVSPGEASSAEALGLCSNKLVVIANGVEVGADLPQGTQPSPFSLVHVSRFDPVKNSLWLLDLAQGLRQVGLLDQCRFLLVGDGEELPTVRQKIQQHAMEKYFQILGSQPSSRPFLREAGCYISTSRREGLPLAVLEAQAEGIPAVVSRVVGNTDAVEDGITGFTYPLNDVPRAVECIRTLIENRDLWQRMRTAAYRRTKKHFSVECMARETAQLYKNILHA
ncbi:MULTISPECIES: glycosyltransferase [unclassified Desulfovibrio]|uniref:glycosyltransferase n=1 Tax=unclassified Desulfovibrio TaxID=2593640 RepID=UPI000F5EEA22|nr:MULTISPECIES: glycosyltransferase [unclassified Desulfovibrio]